MQSLPIIPMFFDSVRFPLIAGPCSLESEALCRTVAESLIQLGEHYPQLYLVFKGSFDKANRTSLRSPRGLGLDKGLKLLSMIKRDYGLPTLTDFHTPEQAAPVAEVCDILQIPAFLCRQTDLLVAASQTGRVVNVKKGQFMAPQEMQYVVEKLKASNAKEIWLTERGHTFGYNNLVVDMRTFAMLEPYGCPCIFDVTHSVQLPGAVNGKSGGQREFVPPLARAALAAGAQGLFVETHSNPSQAISDAASQWPLADLPELIDACLAIWQITPKPPKK